MLTNGGARLLSDMTGFAVDNASPSDERLSRLDDLIPLLQRWRRSVGTHPSDPDLVRETDAAIASLAPHRLTRR